MSRGGSGVCEPVLEAEVWTMALSGLVGERLDRACLARWPQFSRARVQAWIDTGHILVNDVAVKPAYRLRADDVIRLEPPPVVELAVQAEPIPLDVVYEDGDLIVVNKPQGLVVHPANGATQGTLVNALLHHCSDLSGIGGVSRPGIVHRLDKDTSGLMVVAKHDRAHIGLSEQIAKKQAQRVYWAVIRGSLATPVGRIEAAIGRHPHHRQKMAVRPDGKPAATRHTTLSTVSGYSLVELALETGRTHQIRVHMAHLGHPIVGDPVYGGDRHLPVKLAGQALHARELSFTHPVTGVALHFLAEPPSTMRKLLSHLGLNPSNASSETPGKQAWRLISE